MYLFKIGLHLILLFSLVLGGELDYDGWLQLRMWHSFSEGPGFQANHMTERGNITISSIRNEAAIISQASLTPNDIKQLEDLARNNGKYRLKINVRTSRGGDSTYLTNIRACQLIGSDLEDNLYIWLDSAAEPVAINIVSQAPCSVRQPLANTWHTNVHIKYPDGGPVPDTATYIQKLEREKEARERGETKDNRSFFAKYWMFIVPAIIFLILSSAANPEAAGGSGNAAAQRQ